MLRRRICDRNSNILKLFFSAQAEKPARDWCFTIFNQDWKHDIFNDGRVKYAVVQLEKAPDTGKLHFQGYMQLPKPMRIPGAKRLLECDSAHLEPRKGTREQAADYCKKPESRVDGPWEYGLKSSQGVRYVTFVTM